MIPFDENLVSNLVNIHVMILLMTYSKKTGRIHASQTQATTVKPKLHQQVSES